MSQVSKISNHSDAPNGPKFQPISAAFHAVESSASPQAIDFSWPGGLPLIYHVIVTPSMKAMCGVTSKTATGFTVNLDNGSTIAAGTIDCLVVSG
jgi:hypothetical protein